MLSLFTTFKGIERGHTIDSGLNQDYRKQLANLEKIEEYYRTNYVPVDMTHPLVRLCYRFDWDITQQTFDYYNRADEMKEELCSPLGITTSFNKGEIHKGIFYGEHCLTALVCEVRTENRSKLLSGQSWLNMKPLRILARPGITGVLLRPDLIQEEEPGYCVIGVDVPMLAAMFKRWKLDNQKKIPEERERPEHFVGRYLFSSLIQSQMDATLLNALSSFAVDRKSLRDMTGVQLGLMDHTADYVVSTSKLLGQIEQGATWEKVADHIPSYLGMSMADVVPTIEDRITQANEWALVAASIPYATICAKFSQDNPEETQLTNLWLEMERHYKGDRTFSKSPDKEFGKQIEDAYSRFVLTFLD